MKAFTKFATAAALSLATIGGASAASAATFVNIAVSGTPGSNQIVWDGAAKTLTITNLLTKLDFDDSVFADLGGQDAILNLSASTTDGLTLIGPTFTQTGISGTFEFRSTDLSTVLLAGTFSQYWIQGVAGAKNGALNSVDGTADFSSDLVNLDAVVDDNFGFTFSSITSNGANPPSGYVIANGALQNFTGNNVAGTFAGVVPEPGTWALMIMGFGGAGAMLRSRRRGLAAA
jgi:hypothetical protein